MTTHITGDPAIPDPEERAARNVALFADNIETGFWDDQGRVAPWPDDIDEWTPGTNEPRTHRPRTAAPSSGHDSKTQPSHHSQGPRPFASSLHSSQGRRAATWRSMSRC